jgi:uncharacterized protein involved in response to NO
MRRADRTRARQATSVFLTHGFRPFFLAGGVWSAAALLVWMVVFASGGNLPSRFDPLAWHIHEMLFGFVMATIAGFLLTALPNWTGRPPVSGARLGLLAALWLLGRIACLISAPLSPHGLRQSSIFHFRRCWPGWSLVKSLPGETGGTCR